MYEWRQMTDEERAWVLRDRISKGSPRHTPPHWDLEGERIYLLSATCYEHRCVIGGRDGRMPECAEMVVSICEENCEEIYAWCVLPNHYHVLLLTERIKALRAALGDSHGRSSRAWNLEDHQVSRKVWHNCAERLMRSERHFWATMNYVHHNPVRHGYVARWEDWPFSIARSFLAQVGKEEAARIWRERPLLDYGKGWDDDVM